ncbi:MAG: site-2 protease family protein [Pirellulaceae bacterium]
MELWNTSVMELLANTDPSLWMVIMTKIGLWLKVAVGIGLVIFVHELGHFVAAKSCGVKCEKFYVGFDVPIRIGPIKFPRTLGKFRWGETEYGLGIIPLGGYVKMLGQDDDPRRAAQEAERIRIANENAQPGDDSVPQYTLDPRSFQAKSVLQRMFIISAGVIVNVVTAVMFAAAAFWYGVPYTPAIIGSTRPGDPAWVDGLPPGSKVVSVGTIENNPKLQFRDMTMEILEQGLASKDQPITLTAVKDGEEKKFALVPTLRYDPDELRVAIGVASQSSTTLMEDFVAYPNSSAAEVLDASFREASAVALNGEALPETDGDIYSTPIEEAMRKTPGEPITLTFALKDGSEKQVTLNPQPLKTFGGSFEVGPVTAVVKGSSADKAGIVPGDRIIEFNDHKDLSAFELRTLAFAHEGTAQVVVRRSSGDGKTEELSFDLQPDDLNAVSGEALMDLALGRYGVAYSVSNKLAHVEPGSDLAKSFSPGDLVTRIAFAWKEDQAQEDLLDFIKKSLGVVPPMLSGEPWDIDSYHTPAALVSMLQIIPEGTPIRFLGKSNGKASTANDASSTEASEKEVSNKEASENASGGSKVIDQVIKVQASADRFWLERGLRFEMLRRVHTADSVAEAISLGYGEAVHRGKGVLRFLKLLVTGNLKPDLLGGPVAIFTIAGSHAAEGIPRLLMFLTFLSVNLAILNFLPIPALDGGHMVFLIAEAALGRPVDEEWQARLTMVGVLMLLGLMAFAFYNDIARMVS